MYHKNGKVCKKTKYGREKCKSKAAYFFDDVLDADDWFEDDDDEEEDRQQQVLGTPMSAAGLVMWMWFMGILVLFIVIMLFIMNRRK